MHVSVAAMTRTTGPQITWPQPRRLSFRQSWMKEPWSANVSALRLDLRDGVRTDLQREDGVITRVIGGDIETLKAALSEAGCPLR